MTAAEIYAEMLRLQDRIVCAEIEREEARRTVLVPGPASAVSLEAWLAAHGLDDVITVEASQFLPPDTWIVIDERAIDAGTAEAVQHVANRPLFPEARRCPRCEWAVGAGHSPTCPIYHLTVGMSVLSPAAMIRVTGT